jgi:hypothetical protein
MKRALGIWKTPGMHRRRLGISPVGAFAMCSFFFAAIASGRLANVARGESGDDRAVAEALVLRLEGDRTHASVTGDALRRAKTALERARGFRNAGEAARAKLAEGVAREWAETARDLVSAADAEASAAEVRRKAVEAEAKLERSRVLVEEEIARAGRLTAELQGSPSASPERGRASKVKKP